MEAILAAGPIAVILVAMTLFGVSAVRAGVMGLLLTVFLVGAHFGFPALAGGGFALGAGMMGAGAEAGFMAATILWIILGALVVHQLQVKTGAIEVVRKEVGALSGDKRVLAILIAWFFVLFMEGAAGFGTPVALGAPLLMAFGFSAVRAVALVVIGHSAGIVFGAVGTPLLMQATLLEPSIGRWAGLELAQATGELQAILGSAMLVVVLVMVTRECRRDGVELSPIWGWALLGAAGFLVPMWAIARWVGPELPTMGGALIGGALFVGAMKVFGEAGALERVKKSREMHLWKAGAPYLVLIGLILITRLVGPVAEVVHGVELRWSLFGEFKGSFRPFEHPGTLLFLSALIGARAQGASREVFLEALRDAGKMLVPVAGALVVMLTISRLMVHGQMVGALASGATMVAGESWPFFAPFVGALGSFVTGSATASNILFTEFQAATARGLGLDGLSMVVAQGVGAGVGNIVCPHNIIAGCATVGITGREGEVMRQTLGAFVFYILLAGVVVWFIG